MTGTTEGTDLAAVLCAAADRADLAESTRRDIRGTARRLAAHLKAAGYSRVAEVDADMLSGWIATAANPCGWRFGVRTVFGQLDPAELHPSLVLDGRFDWSPRRRSTAVMLARGNRRTWVDPASYPNVRDVGDALTALLVRVPVQVSAAHARGFGQGLRSLLGYLNGLPAPPTRLDWVSADLLDGWVDRLKAERSNTAYRHGARVRDLLANRPASVALHASLLAPDGVTITWSPAAAPRSVASEDLPFSTVEAVRSAAAADVRAALARVVTATRLARDGAGRPGLGTGRGEPTCGGRRWPVT